jgi:hypothetical protein
MIYLKKVQLENTLVTAPKIAILKGEQIENKLL